MRTTFPSVAMLSLQAGSNSFFSVRLARATSSQSSL